jgi:hypothetical protein
MTASDDKPSKSAETPSEREKRLAEALRANLRRRKKPAKKTGPGEPSP